MAEGLTCGQLSGGQKHLIYLLGVLASRHSHSRYSQSKHAT